MYVCMQGSDDPKAGMLGARVPRVMTNSCKAVRQRLGMGKLGAGRVAMLGEQPLEEK